MATGINIPISYSPGSIDQILKDFDAIISQADISKVFVKDQEKIRAQFATIGQTIQEQLASGKIDLTKINFTGLEKDIEDFARKVAFVLNEAFEKEVAPYAKKITDITDQIVVKQKELSELQQQAAKIGGEERTDFKQKYGLAKMPTLEAGEAKRRLAGAEEELAGDKDNTALQKKVEMYRELLEMLSTEKQRKKEIQDQVGKKELEVLTLTNQKKAVQIDLDKAQAKLGIDAANYSQKLLDLNRLLIVAKENGIDLSEQQIKLLKDQADATEKNTDAGKREEKGLIARAGASFSYGLILGQLRRVYQESLKTVRELDKAMTEAAIVTSMNRQEAYKLLGTYQQLARETGLATSEIGGVISEFLKQGRTMAEAMELAKVAAMSAKVAGISANEAIDYLTSAVNGFGLATDKAKDIADKFAAIAAASATDFEELAIAMSKVAPVAKIAGVSVDFMMGVLAKGLETTREAPENIGTAFKTIFARMREVTDIGKATEDGMSLNRVEKALQSIDVPLRNANGQFRSLEDVLIDVGNKWETLTSIEQAYIATALAGTRQQPRLLAIFNDFARTKELIELSSQATGQLAFQHIEYMQGAEAALSQLRTAWEGFIMAFTDTGLVINAISLITDSVNLLTNLFKGMGDSTFLNIAAIGLLTMALGAMVPNLLLNITNQTVSNVLSVAKVTLTKQEAEEINRLNAQYRTANTLQKQSIINRKKEILANHGQTFSIKGVIAATYAHIKAMIIQIALSGAIALAFAGIGWAVTELIKFFSDASQGVQKFAEEMQKNNKELNDLEENEKNIGKLVNRFDELNKKVVKTTQELDEMNKIAQELESVKIGEMNFSISRTDLTGNIVLDRNAYENFLAAIENERAELLAKNEALFSQAVDNKTLANILKAFSDPTIGNAGKAVGFDYGMNFIMSVKDSFSEENVNDAMDNLKRAMSRISPEFFLSIQGDPTANIAGTYTSAVTSAELLKEKTDQMVASLLEAGIAQNDSAAAMKHLRTLGLLTTDMFKDQTTAAATINEIISKVVGAYSGAKFYFDEDKAKEFGAEMGAIFLRASEKASSLLLGKEGTTSDILTARLTAYRDAINQINTEYGRDTAQANVRIELLKESMQDEAIIDMLLGKRTSMEAIVSFVDRGNSLSKLNDLFNEFIERDGGNENITTFTRAINAAFTETGDLLTGVSSAYKYINSVFGEGSADAAYFINQLSDSLKFLNTTSAATSLTDQGKGIQDLLKLPEQIAKGDFSKYSELVAQFGFDTVNKLLEGNFEGLDPFFNKERVKFEKDINDAIKNIQMTYYNINTEAYELGAAEKEQIAQLELMLTYYDKIAGVEQLRAAVLKDVKELVKETNDLYSLQDKLLTGGMSGDSPFIKMLDKLIEASELDAMGKLGDQLEKDIESLNELGQFVNGQFIESSDSSAVVVETATSRVIETITQLVDIQTAAYNRQKKAIEERYKQEVDAIKQAHDDKWSEIDYNSKLLESEEKIIEARRQLAGLAISGAAQGEYKDAQKALEKLQQEREKIIETQMLDEAQKELEQQRNDDLIAAQEQFTNAIRDYTNTISGLRETVSYTANGVGPLNQSSETNQTIQENNIQLAETATSLDNLNTSNMLSVEKTNELIDVNSLLVQQLEELTFTISNWRVIINNATGTSGNADGLGTT